jgi:ferric-dicitrate binding protein FerR (iron transport regulator)
MNIPRYAVAAAKLLRRAVESVPPPRGDRARGLMAIEHAMAARGRRRRWLWSGLAVLAAVAALLVVWQLRSRGVGLVPHSLAAVSPLGDGASLRVGTAKRPLLAQTTVGTGATIETADEGGAALQLATRSSLVLSGATSLRFDSNDRTQRFMLGHGGLLAHVAKLTEGQRFIVNTPDAEVEVRGTRFLLRVLQRPEACGFGSRTRLEVSEGVVEVRSAGTTSRVAVGQTWPADCAHAARPAAGEVAEEAAEARPAAVAANPSNATAGSGRPGVATGPTAGGPSALTQQNDLFAEGVALRRQGDVAGALRAYQDLIAQFPTSPLAENAMVERMRLLSATQHSRAKEEARRYLRHYPGGFALEEARRLTDEP